MIKYIATALVGATVGIGAVVGAAVAVSDAPLVAIDNSTVETFDFSQGAFPCEEDQALQFDPRFGNRARRLRQPLNESKAQPVLGDRLGIVHRLDVQPQPSTGHYRKQECNGYLRKLN